MRVTSVLIKNVLGISEASLECGAITEIKGKNGSGKSSVLQAIQAGLQGGNLARLQKVGTEEEAEVVLVLDGGKYRVERKGTDLAVKQRVGNSAAYETVKRPQELLDSLFDPLLSNPMRFLNAHPNDRADMMLEVLPIELDRDALMKRIGDVWPSDKPLVAGHPLQVLAYARTVLYDERTGVNRTQKDKESSAYELLNALPAEMPADPRAELKKATAARDELVSKLATRRAEAEGAHWRAVEAAGAAYDKTADGIESAFKLTAAKLRAQEEREIAAIRERTTKAIAAEQKTGDEALAAAEAAQAAAQTEADEKRREALALVDALQPDLRQLEEKAATLAAQVENNVRLQETRRLYEKHNAEAESLKDVSARLTAAIEAVDLEKMALAKDLPIPGLEIQGKQILVNGVAFDQLNTGQRIQIAVKVATLRARTKVLPAIFVDGAEALDREHYDLLVKELEASGCQVFIAPVRDESLNVETREGTPPASEAKVVQMPPTQTVARRGRRALAE